MLRLLGLSCAAALAACALPTAPEPEPGTAGAASLAPAVASAQSQAAEPAPPMSGPHPPLEAVSEPAPFTTQALASFDEPWAMAFLPDGRALVAQKKGQLKLVTISGSTATSVDVGGVPAVAYGGQGGLGDVVLHPQFASNRWIYLSYAEAGPNSTRGAVVARYRLDLSAGGAALSDRRLIWTQAPKVTGEGHYGHRLAFGPDGLLWITSGDRQKFDPAQDLSTNLGKVVRLRDDGSIPPDNPFAEAGGVRAQLWSWGHRNPLGIAFDAAGQLWTHEMGPQGGDELNLIEKGANYGWPLVSNGSHYGGADIPDHVTRPDLNPPEISWTPVIAPAGFVIYSGDRFPQWRGHGLIGGLASQALVRVEFHRDIAREVARYPMGRRIREVEQGPGGEVYVLEDGAGGRLLRLVPKP
ncbi:MAG: PQQ-dependent sugar dehydrogenase [Pseudomonadota bacterium]